MHKQAAFKKVFDSFAPKPDDRLDRRVWWEIRAWRLRLALAENELAWAQEAMTSGYINASGALEVLNEVMDGIGEARP